MSTTASPPIAPSDPLLEQWRRDGYVIVEGLFSPEEVDAVKARFEKLAEGPVIEGHWNREEDGELGDPGVDPLLRYPRVLHPHRFDELSRRMMLHPRIRTTLAALIGEEPVAVQSMYYFKPPGARGQALHQDNLYLAVQPDTCYAAWVAIDHAHPGNGGMYLVPGTHRMDILCPEEADLNESFTAHLVNAPRGMKATPAVMKPGDGLFFNGSVIHGSGANRSTDAWRRSFICHYMPRGSKRIAEYYFPVLDFDGNEIPYEVARDGGMCGEHVKVQSYGTSFEARDSPA